MKSKNNFVNGKDPQEKSKESGTRHARSIVKHKHKSKPVLNLKILNAVLKNPCPVNKIVAKPESLIASPQKSVGVKRFPSIGRTNNSNFKDDRPTKYGNQTTVQTKRELFQNQAQQRLYAAQFRLLNEKLYTTTGAEAFKYFQQEDPDSYLVYHKGFQQQVSKWPVDPLDVIISDIKKMSLKSSRVIADLGCGEAKLAKELKSTKRTVYSYDLKALNEDVIECDIAQVPLEDESVDVVVLCLSLMGTNLKDYLYSACRILKTSGTLKIAEVQSRFQDVKEFVTSLKRFGFKLIKEDSSNNYFVLMDFSKRCQPPKKSRLPDISLDPCVYKKR